MSLSDQLWCPASAQVTVLQARGLRIKGKGGTNDAYAVMQVGKEKYQTSVVEKSVAPVWKEEATFDLPQQQQRDGGGGTERSTLHVHVLHRALVGPDKLLGQAVINLLQLSEDRTRSKTEWFKLLDKTGKADKDRGEVLVDIQFMRNNMTASMFDLSAAGKSRSRLGKLKDKVRGKKKESDTMSTIVPSFTQVLTDSEEEGNGDAEAAAGKDEKKKKHKMKSLFSPKSNLQKNMSQSMSVLPGKNSQLSGSQSSGLNVDPSEGKKKFKFKIHKRSGSSDNKDSSSGLQKHGATEQTNLCINGSHIYCEEPPARTSRIGSNFSLASSGHGSMEDVPDSSPPSVDSLRGVRQYSPWTEEEEEMAEVENIKEDVEEERITLEEEEERMRQEEEDAERLAEEKRRQERRRVEEEEKRQKEEEERIRIQEEMRRQEEQRLAEEKRRLEEEERKRNEEEKLRKEEEERIQREEEERGRREEEERARREEERERLAEEKRRLEEEERARREEERERLAEEKRRLEEEEEEERRRIKEEEKRQREEEDRIRMAEERAKEEKRRQEEERKLAEEKMRLEEEERRMIEEEEVRRLEEQERKRIEEEERIRKEEEMAQEQWRREEEESAKRREEERKLAEQKRRLEEEERRQREEEERISMEEERKRQEEEDKLAEEKRRLEEEERRRIEEEEVRKEEEEKRKEEEERRRREEEELVRKLEEEHEEKRRLEEQERKRKEEEEERIKKEEEEKARREKEEYERLVEKKMKQEEEERKRIEAEEKIRKEEEEREKAEEDKRRKEEERRQEEEREKLAEEKRIMEEQQRKIEEEKKKQMEEEERIRKDEARKHQEEEGKRREEEERIRQEEQDNISMEKKRRSREAEENRIKMEEEERARKLEKVIRNAEEQKKRANKTKQEVAGSKSKVGSSADVRSTNPFDEDFSNNPFDENPNSPDSTTMSTVQQRGQPAVSSAGSKTSSTDEKDLIGSQREKRPAPLPPGRNQVERRSQREQDGSIRHLVQVNEQSKDKDDKTVSVPPQRSVHMIAPLSRSPTDAKNPQSLVQSKGKRPAPSAPAEPKKASSPDGKIANKSSSEAKLEPTAYGLNPFEDDEDENEPTAQDTAGSIQGPPAVSQAADGDAASQAKIKSSKKARAPLLPATTAATSSTLISQNAEGGHDTGVTTQDDNLNHPRHPEEAPVQQSQPVMAVAQEAPPVTSRRLQPVKPLNPLGQQLASVAQGEMDNKSTGIHSEVQEKTKANDTELKGPYSQLTREELISLVLKQDNQLSERDKKICELEQYIDNLLVRVMEESPTILMSMNSMKKTV